MTYTMASSRPKVRPANADSNAVNNWLPEQVGPADQQQVDSGWLQPLFDDRRAEDWQENEAAGAGLLDHGAERPEEPADERDEDREDVPSAEKLRGSGTAFCVTSSTEVSIRRGPLSPWETQARPAIIPRMISLVPAATVSADAER